MADYDYLSAPNAGPAGGPPHGYHHHHHHGGYVAVGQPVMQPSVMVRCGRCGVPNTAYGGVQWATCGQCGMLNNIHPSLWWVQPTAPAPPPQYPVAPGYGGAPAGYPPAPGYGGAPAGYPPPPNPAASGARQEEIRKLTAFYQAHGVAKMPAEVEGNVDRFAGNWGQMWDTLHKKYGPAPKSAAPMPPPASAALGVTTPPMPPPPSGAPPPPSRAPPPPAGAPPPPPTDPSRNHRDFALGSSAYADLVS